LSEKITEFVQHAGKTPLLGISIGVPGVVDKKKGTISYMPSFNISNLNLESVLKDKFELPVYLENDVTLSAYGEIWIGNGKQYNTILLVSIGTGIGGGIVIDNKVHTGLGGNAGEICDMVTDWTQERDKKSGFGRLEEWVGGHALEQFISEKKIGKDLRYFANIDKKNEEFDNFLLKPVKIRIIFSYTKSIWRHSILKEFFWIKSDTLLLPTVFQIYWAANVIPVLKNIQKGTWTPKNYSQNYLRPIHRLKVSMI
jgi:hypothetical protein